MPNKLSLMLVAIPGLLWGPSIRAHCTTTVDLLEIAHHRSSYPSYRLTSRPKRYLKRFCWFSVGYILRSTSLTLSIFIFLRHLRWISWERSNTYGFVISTFKEPPVDIMSIFCLDKPVAIAEQSSLLLCVLSVQKFLNFNEFPYKYMLLWDRWV